MPDRPSTTGAAPAYLGIDVGGTNIKSVVLAAGTTGPVVLAKDECPTLGTTPSEILGQVISIARRTRDSRHELCGLGFCLPGAIDRRGGSSGVMPNLPGDWDGLPVRELVRAGTELPTCVINDARAFTLAEARIGAARGLETVVGVTLGTGLGGGIAIGGVLHEGASGFAGELGHQILVPDGEPCGCGNDGCAETRVSTRAILSRTRLDNVRIAFERADAGDSDARNAVDSYIHHLAIALANVHTLLCPDAFVIGGGVAAAGPRLFDPLLAQLRELITFDKPANVHLRPAQLGPIAGAIGAALIAMSADD